MWLCMPKAVAGSITIATRWAQQTRGEPAFLVYAKGADHPLRDTCRELIAAIAEGKIEASTTVEVIQEFVHVRACRRDRVDAAALGRDYAEIFSPLGSPSSCSTPAKYTNSQIQL